MNKQLWKKIGTYAGIVVFFAVLSYGFVPQVLDGKIVNQSDISGYIGMAQETHEWNEAHPEDRTAWTGSMFGGMPTTMLTGNGKGDWTQPLYNLMLKGRRPASYLLISLLGAFLLMLALGVHWGIAVGGAIAVTFCSYNMQIIQVGHNAKMLALAYAPWVLAGVIFTYKSALRDGSWREWLPKTLLGAALFAMALNFQIKANHVQITYYLAIIVASYALVMAVWLLARERKRFGRFAAASGLLLVLGGVGIATNANRLIPTYLYTQETMRGGSELSGEESKGLDIGYATSWSYGWEELPNLMIPDYNGGASARAVNPDKSETIKLLKRAGQGNLRAVAKALPMYWGPQPFTAGPMYMGAITVFLFILGLGLCKGKERWWLLIPTVIGVFLALGNHFMPWTKFWYYYVPFYNKFRTVSMALVILQLTLPMLGFLTLDRIVREQYSRKDFLRWGLIALGITAGFCLLSLTGMGRSFSGAADAGQPDVLVEAFAADRLMLLRHDATMALVLIVATFCLLLWAYGAKEPFAARGRMVIAGASVCLLVLINMFAVGKRYLNKDHFVTERQFQGQFKASPADEAILADPAPSYRVLDLTVNVFNDSHPSYFHKNIGGYSPVKLQRYQDLIDKYLSGEINAVYKAVRNAKTVSEVRAALPPLPVLSLLNDKYIILDPEAAPLVNPGAQGPCWLVSDLVTAATPDEEIALLGAVDLRRTAVLGPDFEAVAQQVSGADLADEAGEDYITLTRYAPNELRYHYHADKEVVAVFSEIWYPRGWKAWIADGPAKGDRPAAGRKEGSGSETSDAIDLFRTDWTLRGAILPPGDHDIVMRFDPPSYRISSGISRASSITLLLLLLLAVGFAALPVTEKR